jgi:hypothetical protein
MQSGARPGGVENGEERPQARSNAASNTVELPTG